MTPDRMPATVEPIRVAQTRPWRMTMPHGDGATEDSHARGVPVSVSRVTYTVPTATSPASDACRSVAGQRGSMSLRLALRSASNQRPASSLLPLQVACMSRSADTRERTRLRTEMSRRCAFRRCRAGHPRRINHTFVMKPQPRGEGNYLGVCLYNTVTGVPRYKFIQVLVMLTFVGPKPAGMQVNHKNLNKHDNRLGNLEYSTPRDNTLHALRNGAKRNTGKGLCLTADKIRAIQQLPHSISIRAAGKLFGTSRETIRQIRNGTRWKCLDD